MVRWFLTAISQSQTSTLFNAKSEPQSRYRKQQGFLRLARTQYANGWTIAKNSRAGKISSYSVCREQHHRSPALFSWKIGGFVASERGKSELSSSEVRNYLCIAAGATEHLLTMAGSLRRDKRAECQGQKDFDSPDES